MARSFPSALREGQDAERGWVDKMRSLGLAVAHGKKITVRRHDKQKDFVESPDAAALFAIEIKQRDVKFTSEKDFPYPTVFVNNNRSVEKATVVPMIYVFVSRPTGKWVWLSMLDQDETWTSKPVWDTGRRHTIDMLSAPTSFLRSAKSLMRFMVSHKLLGLVDGDTEMFRDGGGEVESRDRYVAVTHPDVGGRERVPKKHGN